MNFLKMLLAMFLCAFSLIVFGAASQLGTPVGSVGMIAGLGLFGYVIWDTLIKHIWQQRA